MTVADAGPGHDVGQGRQLDTRLAERRKDLFDVGEEQSVRAHHEHTLALEREPVRVEKVGRPVERHDGLAGARSALHGQHAREWCPDDQVLLGLDGADDVAEATGAGRLEGGDEGALST